MPIDPQLRTVRPHFDPWYSIDWRDNPMETVLRRRELPGERSAFILWYLLCVVIRTLVQCLCLILASIVKDCMNFNLDFLDVSLTEYFTRSYARGILQARKLYRQDDYLSAYIKWIYSPNRVRLLTTCPSLPETLLWARPWTLWGLQKILSANL